MAAAAAGQEPLEAGWLLDNLARQIPECGNSRIRGALVNDRLEFDTVCPNNHNKAVTFE